MNKQIYNAKTVLDSSAFLKYSLNISLNFIFNYIKIEQSVVTRFDANSICPRGFAGRIRESIRLVDQGDVHAVTRLEIAAFRGLTGKIT